MDGAVDGVDPENLKQQLRDKNINVSVAIRDHTRLEFESRSLDKMIRSSVHYYNTEEEIMEFCRVLGEMVS